MHIFFIIGLYQMEVDVDNIPYNIWCTSESDSRRYESTCCNENSENNSEPLTGFEPIDLRDTCAMLY